ncbi:Serine/threonine-protein kinase HT1 [Hordeum vulgare]|nr:Serine/threonine-protein kinase HT1 [Hordeum vulgare]
MAATSSTGQKKFTVAVAVGIVSTPVHDQRVQRQACRLVGGSSRASVGRLRQEVERLRLARNFGGAVKSCLAVRCYAESWLVGRCYAREISRSLRIWTDERRAVASLGAVVASTDDWTGKDDADLFPEDGLTMIDLNEEPDENNGDHVYCTQHAAGNTEFVAESPNPPMIRKVSVAAIEGIFTDGHSSRGMAAPVIHKYLQQ